jgi:hypothetical protein
MIYEPPRWESFVEMLLCVTYVLGRLPDPWTLALNRPRWLYRPLVSVPSNPQLHIQKTLRQLKTFVFWNIKPCSPLKVNRRSYLLHAGFLLDFFLRNVGWLSTDHMALHPRRQNSLHLPLWESQILFVQIILLFPSRCALRHFKMTVFCDVMPYSRAGGICFLRNVCN